MYCSDVGLNVSSVDRLIRERRWFRSLLIFRIKNRSIVLGKAICTSNSPQVNLDLAGDKRVLSILLDHDKVGLFYYMV